MEKKICGNCGKEVEQLFWDRRFGFVCYTCACTPTVDNIAFNKACELAEKSRVSANKTRIAE